VGCESYLVGPGLTENPNFPTRAEPDQLFLAAQARLFVQMEGQLARTTSMWVRIGVRPDGTAAEPQLQRPDAGAAAAGQLGDRADAALSRRQHGKETLPGLSPRGSETRASVYDPSSALRR
jgi:hypothetical protein